MAVTLNTECKVPSRSRRIAAAARRKTSSDFSIRRAAVRSARLSGLPSALTASRWNGRGFCWVGTSAQ